MVSGNKILLDTNAFIYFFEGRPKIKRLIVQTPEIYFSPITEIELLSTTRLTSTEIKSIKEFLALCQKVDLSTAIVDQTIAIRQKYSFKIPDAIIAASALHLNMPLVSADAEFAKITNLHLIADIL